ncbi:MAG: zinc ribbon domain-containing protein [Clostridiales bacterium]|nr:zinc ribbon domain-containing protein [Clostridiales bacterium]
MDIKNEKPRIFKILKIIGYCLLGLGIILIIIGICTKVPEIGKEGWYEANSTKNSFIFGGIGCLVFTILILSAAYKPEIAKFNAKTTKYIQKETKEDLKEIASNTADITSEAITKTTKAIKKGLEDKVFCKHCGESIDSDSKFCNKCGKEQ